MTAELNEASFDGTVGQLEKGDEIILKAGFGFPEEQVERVDVIVSVDGLSALTARGVMLSYQDGAGVIPTGRKIEYELSDRAKIILEKRFS